MTIAIIILLSLAFAAWLALKLFIYGLNCNARDIQWLILLAVIPLAGCVMKEQHVWTHDLPMVKPMTWGPVVTNTPMCGGFQGK